MANRIIPFGYKAQRGSIFINPSEAEAVIEIFNMYCEDATLADIALHLASGNIPYGNGCDWNKMCVKRIVENEKYTGTEEYPRIVPDELFEKAVQMRRYKAERYGRREPGKTECVRPIQTSFVIHPTMDNNPPMTIDEIYTAAQSRYLEIHSAEISEV